MSWLALIKRQTLTAVLWWDADSSLMREMCSSTCSSMYPSTPHPLDLFILSLNSWMDMHYGHAHSCIDTIGKAYGHIPQSVHWHCGKPLQLTLGCEAILVIQKAFFPHRESSQNNSYKMIITGLKASQTQICSVRSII